MTTRSVLIPLSLGALAVTMAGADERTYDVAIYGGTSAGVAAAVQVRNLGKSAVLIEPGHHLGGLTSGGLGRTDSGVSNRGREQRPLPQDLTERRRKAIVEYFAASAWLLFGLGAG